MSRRTSTQLAQPAFPLTDSDRAFLGRIESLIHTITDRIAAFTQNYDPAQRPPSPKFPLSYNYFAYPREYNHCARTLQRLQELWHMVRTLLHQAEASAQPSPAPLALVPSQPAAPHNRAGAADLTASTA